MHKNNFDFLRLIFALSLIITHSYPLTGLSEWEYDWLSKITNGQATHSYIGVRGFFIISGFLVYQSLIKSNNLAEYFWRGVLRLYPVLIVGLLLTIVWAYFSYAGDLQSYLSNASVKSYLLNNLTLFKIQHSIDGVFQTNPISAINGSLWIIPYGCFFYILIGVLWFFRKWKPKYLLLFSLIFAIAIFFGKDQQTWRFLYLDAKYILELGAFFLTGSFLASIEVEKYNNKKILFFAGFSLFILSIKFYNFQIFQFFSLPLMIIPFGVASTLFLKDISSRIGDLSYGIYIYGYPVQQTLEYYFKLDSTTLMISSLLVVMILAYFSWHLVEKRALSLKRIQVSFSFKKGTSDIKSIKMNEYEPPVMGRD